MRTALSARELSVWRTFLRAHASITRRLEHDLAAGHMLPLPSYDVLLQLAESPQRRLRMTELADRVLLSRSGLTRLVDRLAADGLVDREPCPSDARGTFTVLTEAGLARLREAAPTHLHGIEEHVTSRLTAQELDTLGRLLRKLLTPADAVAEPKDCGVEEGLAENPAPETAAPRTAAAETPADTTVAKKTVARTTVAGTPAPGTPAPVPAPAST